MSGWEKLLGGTLIALAGLAWPFFALVVLTVSLESSFTLFCTNLSWLCALRELALTPFHEEAYRRLADFLRKYKWRVYLPILRELCTETRYTHVAHWIPSTFLRVWEPVLELVQGAGLASVCYLEEEDVRNSVETGVRIASLVLKARVHGKLDLGEWLAIIPCEPLKPRFTNWSGLLVVDRFTEYYIMVKEGVYADRVVQLGTFAPTPADLLVLSARGLIEWKCSLEDTAWWVVKYIGDYVIPSASLSEAYRRLVSSKEYVEFISKCAPNEEVLHYWLWTPQL